MIYPVILAAYAATSEGAAILIPGCERFGVKSVSVLSPPIASDISAITLAQQLTGRASANCNTQEKFSSEYFPHLPKDQLINPDVLNCTFNVFDPSTTVFASRTSIGEDSSSVLDIQVCKLQRVELDQISSNEDNFISRYKNVSSSVILN